jgi:hypothetical protein
LQRAVLVALETTLDSRVQQVGWVVILLLAVLAVVVRLETLMEGI